MSAQAVQGGTRKEQTISVKRASQLLKDAGRPHSARTIHALIEEGTHFMASRLRARGWYAIDYRSFMEFLNRPNHQ